MVQNCIFVCSILYFRFLLLFLTDEYQDDKTFIIVVDERHFQPLIDVILKSHFQITFGIQ